VLECVCVRLVTNHLYIPVDKHNFSIYLYNRKKLVTNVCCKYKRVLECVCVLIITIHLFIGAGKYKFSSYEFNREKPITNVYLTDYKRVFECVLAGLLLITVFTLNIRIDIHKFSTYYTHKRKTRY
jgi:hypothetical protein